MNRWAMCRTPPAAAAPSAARPAFVCAIRIAAAIGAARRDLVQEAGQVPREVVERAARRHHVDEPEQRRAQLAVAGGELHRAGVERAHRVAGAGRERGRQLAADPPDLALERLALGRASARSAGHVPGPSRVEWRHRLERHPSSCRWARTRSSAAPPPRSPNSRLAYSR